eukprot:TRINITY_DN18800_c0_g1_i3.p1 TRINITY_DN18800_c0_g1~~TRINITY_DN18800_c0_g1_i3.p1  ORF type:complete len:176 (-),score=29.34 TRINITY_DN18800_c0_g1_i3:145-672(-)
MLILGRTLTIYKKFQAKSVRFLTRQFRLDSFKMVKISCILLVALLAPVIVSGAVKRECDSSHPKVGCMAELRDYAHDVGGTIQIDDDCSFSVNLTYDGTGPDVFWYGALTQEALKTGIIIDPENGLPSSHGPWDEELVENQLPESVSWDDVNFLSVWCVSFGINFGDADFTDCQE